jgi:hypothetical protein
MKNQIEELQTKAFWDDKWKTIFDKYQQDLRHAYYVAAFLQNDIESILEIGAGSFRDIAFLASLKKKKGAFDFSSEACMLAQQQYPALANFFWQDDAFKINIPNVSFDLSYSNGFIGCFDDEKIELLVREQLRITKKQLIITLHNGHNQAFQEYFDSKKVLDNLFDIRFFRLSDIQRILSKFSFTYKVYPVGKAYKGFEDILIQKNATFDEIKESIIAQGLVNLETSERLMIVSDPLRN